MKLLDRYVIRNFLQVYVYCIAGFISIWLIFDVSDNISTFIDEHVALLLVARYYATQIPQVLIILLPVSLLLSLLFTLGRMSRANEIVSMLTAGISLPRVLMPLIGMGLLAAVMLAQTSDVAKGEGVKNDKPGEAAPAASTDYVIGADDMLHISVWKEPDLSEILPVRPDGKISMPLLNDVTAAGLTPLQLKESITG